MFKLHLGAQGRCPQFSDIWTPISLFVDLFGWPVTLLILAGLTALDISLFYDSPVILPCALRLFLWSTADAWAVLNFVLRMRGNDGFY